MQGFTPKFETPASPARLKGRANEASVPAYCSTEVVGISNRTAVAQPLSIPPKSLDLPTHLRHPPSRPHQQKSPVLQKLRRFSFDRVPHKLQQPPKAKQPDSHPKQLVPHNRSQQHRQRQNNNRYPNRMRQPVQRMLMALRVLRNPAIPTSSAKHGDTILSHLHHPQPKSFVSASGFSSLFAVKPTTSSSRLQGKRWIKELSPAWPRSGSRI